MLRAKNREQGNFTPDPGGGFPALTDATSGVSNSDWSMGYIYDDNGNLSRRKDARDLVTAYEYDHLNRNTTTSYTNDPASTPAVLRAYDQAANGKGRSSSTQTTGDSSSVIVVESYDGLGRPLAKHEEFYYVVGNHLGFKTYSLQRSYDLAGQVVTQAYPSGHTVKYDYDAAGRISSFGGNLGDGVNRTYASEFQYSETGALQQEKFGTDTPLYHKQRYN